MQPYKKSFIEFLLGSNALKITSNPDRSDGCFVLKSGRISPFFMNMGDLNSGEQLIQLGTAYADAAFERFGKDFDIVFGPAYKGIPLAVVTAEALNRKYNMDVRFCTNRKEVKDHGDTGILLGSKLKDGDRVVIIEDVTTSGKSIDETMPVLKAQANVEVVGLVVSFDRMEVASEGADHTALEEIAEKYGIKTGAIVSIADVLMHMQEEQLLPIGTKQLFKDYYANYGVSGRRIVP